MNQLLLDLTPHKTSYLAEDFLPLSNSFYAHQLALSSLRNNIMGCLILGPEGVGKTHLLHVCHQTVAANNDRVELINDINELGDVNVNKHYLFVSNIKSLNKDQEEKLFHWYNHLKQVNGKMFLELGSGIDDIVNLPDLKSRLFTLQQAILEHPKEKDLEIFILKQAFDHQVEISEDVLSYLTMRIERNLSKAVNLFNQIDKQSLIEKRKITVPFIKQFLD